MDAFEIRGRIGEGAHGVVFKAQHVESGRVVAMKRVGIRRLDDGIPVALLREIQALRHLDHESIVRLHDVFAHGTAIVLVLELMVTDLAQIMQQATHSLPEDRVKCYMRMLLSGVAYCHAQSILVRPCSGGNT